MKIRAAHVYLLGDESLLTLWLRLKKALNRVGVGGRLDGFDLFGAELSLPFRLPLRKLLRVIRLAMFCTLELRRWLVTSSGPGDVMSCASLAWAPEIHEIYSEHEIALLANTTGNAQYAWPVNFVTGQRKQSNPLRFCNNLKHAWTQCRDSDNCILPNVIWIAQTIHCSAGRSRTAQDRSCGRAPKSITIWAFEFSVPLRNDQLSFSLFWDRSWVTVD